MATISGKITDSSNEAMPYVVVFQSDKDGKPLSGAKNTTSDDNGNYIISGVSDTDYLTFRMVGTNPQTVLVSTGKGDSNKRTLDVKLGASASTTLPEVVVVADKPKPKTENEAVTPPKKPKRNYAKYFLFGALGVLAIVGIVYATKKMTKGGKK